MVLTLTWQRCYLVLVVPIDEDSHCKQVNSQTLLILLMTQCKDLFVLSGLIDFTIELQGEIYLIN